MEYTEPDYCPTCHDGAWADRDNCYTCNGNGYVCPVCQSILETVLAQAPDITVWRCIDQDWTGTP